MMQPSPASFEEGHAQYSAFLWSRVYYWARRNPAVAVEDLMQEGLIALRDALVTFDPNGGSGFLAWLAWGVNNNMRRHCIKMGNTVRVPVYRFGKHLVNVLSLNSGMDESVREEVDEALGRTESDPDEGPDLHLLTRARQAITTLPARSQTILEQHFIHGRTMTDIAGELGVTKQAVFAAKDAALRKLRHHPLLRKEAA